MPVSIRYISSLLSANSYCRKRQKSHFSQKKYHLFCTCHVSSSYSHTIRQPIQFSTRQRLFRADRTPTCRVIEPELHPCPPQVGIFADFDRQFSHVETTGKLSLFQHVPRATGAPQRPETPQRHAVVTSSRQCANFSALLGIV